MKFQSAVFSGQSVEKPSWQVDALYRPGPADSPLPQTSGSSPPVVAEKTVSLQADAAPAADLIFTLAREAGIELDLRTDLEKPITLSLSQRPLQEVLKRMASMAGFHFFWQGETLIIDADALVARSYALPILAASRHLDSSLSMTTQVAAQLGENAGAQDSNNSRATLSTQSQHDLWESIVEAVSLIIGQDENHSVAAQPAAGLLLVRASRQAHAVVADYIDTLKRQLRRQVLIEALVLEVVLDESHQSGVDLSALVDGGDSLALAQRLIPGGGSARGNVAAPDALLDIAGRSGAVSIALTLQRLQQFGEVHVLSRPRLHAMHQQPALLRVVDNLVYFQTGIERDYDDEGNLRVQTTGTRVHTVPVGLVLQVLPVVENDGSVTLNLRPTISRVLRFRAVPDPALADATAGFANEVPELQVRELESVLRVPSGAVAILGGLIQQNVADEVQYVPGLADLPFLGGLFRRQAGESARSELLILIRPTVLSADTVRPL